jgi:hypothetical protein
MRVCLTVHGEQPIKYAASRIERGVPSLAPGWAGLGPAGGKDAPGSRGIGPCWGGKWGGKRFPPATSEKPRNRADLGHARSRAFGSEVGLR